MFREDILDIKKELNEMKKEEQGFATMILHDYKQTNKRLFILCIVELAIIVSMFVGVLVYLNQYDFSTEYSEQSVEDVNSSTINQNM